MKKKLRRGMVWLIGLAVAVPALVLALIALWVSPVLHIGDGTVVLTGLKAPVEIVRDRDGVPHIKAAHDEDAYFALGFMHARDRFWQMETTRRLAAGRLAEIAGKPALESDRLMRTLGLARLAEAQYAHAPESLRRTLQAYAEGVNAWLRTHRGALAPEFFALRYRPEPWRPVESLYWGKLMSVRLSLNWRRELLRFRLAHKLSAEKLRDLWPPFTKADPATIAATEETAAVARTGAAVLARVERILGPVGEASNAWVLAGRHTASSKPILANDPHLEFGMPILWYMARIDTPTLTLSGVTVPGFPLHVLGQNGDIAWGLTTAQGDVADLFIETPDPADPGRYLTPTGSAAFTVRREIIVLKGAPPVTIEVRETRHGPVISDLTADTNTGSDATGQRVILALQATFLRPDDGTPEAAYLLNQARDWPSFIAALRHFHAPQQNILYADRVGNIGLVAAGRVPVRKNGRGWLPRDGRTGAYDWQGYIPFEAVPKTFNPPSGMIVNANNRVIGDEYPYFLSEDWAPGYRAERIAMLLKEREKHDTASTADIQMDTLSLMAREIMPLMLDGLAPGAVSAEQIKVIGLLKEWTGEMSGDRSEPLIFNAWLRELIRVVAADDLGDDFGQYWAVRPRFIRLVLTGKNDWCDDLTTKEIVESCADALHRSLGLALSRLRERYGEDTTAWRWGQAHRIRFRHPFLGRVPLIEHVVNRTRETAGGAFTPNKGAYYYRSETAPFENRHGPGFRGIYDLGDPDRSRFMIATGQSGNPLSPLYDNFLDAWLLGKSLSLGGISAEAEKSLRGRLRLSPAPMDHGTP
ncbi:MAG: penicillin acylase family protein [Rhodospirillales bacterium]